MNIENNSQFYNNEQSNIHENEEFSKFMKNCFEKGYELNPVYKQTASSEPKAYASFEFNEKNLQLVYAIVASIRLEGYEFSFEKIGSYEAAFDIIDSLNEKDNTQLFSRLNEIIENFDVSKNYYYELPEDLQKYFDICNKAFGDNKLTSKNNKQIQVKYGKKDGVNKYTIKTHDTRYQSTANKNNFTISSDDDQLYELASTDVSTLSDSLSNFNDDVSDIRVEETFDEDLEVEGIKEGNIKQTEGVSEEEVPEEITEEQTPNEETPAEVITGALKEVDLKEVKEGIQNTLEDVIEIVDEEEIDLDQNKKSDTLHSDESNPPISKEEAQSLNNDSAKILDEKLLNSQDNSKFMELSHPKQPLEEEPMQMPKIDLQEINRMLFEQPEMEEESVMVR